MYLKVGGDADNATNACGKENVLKVEEATHIKAGSHWWCEKMSSPKKAVAEKEETKVNVLELLEDDDEFEVFLLFFIVLYSRLLLSRNRLL